MKKIIGCFILLWIVFSFVNSAEFAIIPEEDNWVVVENAVKHVSTPIEETSVRDRYNEKANDKNMSLWDKLAAWTLNRDDLLDYVVYLVKFLSWAGLLIWAVMIIYAGYMYATDIMWWDASKWKSAIKYAISGVVVVAFSFALIKILTSMFIE